jgi:LacI family transcriptional regulator
MQNIEIAKRAGVSPATVSRVLRNSPGVSQKAIDKVTSVLEKQGYRLDVRRKRGGGAFKNRSIAFLVLNKDVLQPYSAVFAQTVDGVESALAELGVSLIYAKSYSAQTLPHQVLDGAVDGLILTGLNPREDVVARLNGVPSVWLCSHHERGQAVVLGGNQAIGRVAAQHLIGRGHKHLAVLNALPGYPALNVRCEFFEYYAKQGGCLSVQSFIQDKQKNLSHGSLDELIGGVGEMIDRMLESSSRPTGLFIPIDSQVAMAYEHLRSRGIDVGREMELIGCDNDKMALMGLYPKPATIEIDAVAIGRRAVQELVWRIENPQEKRQTVSVSVEPTLITAE